MNSLILRNDGHNFEEMYYHAVCMGDREKAREWYQTFLRAPTPHFWHDAFESADMSETILMSAIINKLEMPFGAYVFRQLDDQCMEIVPWLYSESLNRREMMEELFSEETTPEVLDKHARTLALTADFLHWLEKYREAHPA